MNKKSMIFSIIMLIIAGNRLSALKPNQGDQYHHQETLNQETLNNNLLSAAASGGLGGNYQPVVDALKAGADVDAQDEQGWTALMIAANKYGSKNAVQTLIDAKANVNIKDSKGNTALLLAIRSDSHVSATELSNNGADTCDLSPADLKILETWNPQLQQKCGIIQFITPH